MSEPGLKLQGIKERASNPCQSAIMQWKKGGLDQAAIKKKSQVD
jgi:hypothetical protein